MNHDREKRLLLASVLAMGFLFFWSSYVVKQPKPATAPVSTPQPQETPAAFSPTVVEPVKVERQNAIQAKSFTTSHGSFDIVWSTLGGTPKQILLKSYTKELQGVEPVEVFPFTVLQDSSWAPLSLELTTGAGLVKTADIVFERVDSFGSSDQVQFTQDVGHGLTLTQSYRVLKDKPYALEVRARLDNALETAQEVKASWLMGGTLPKVKSRSFLEMFAPQEEGRLLLAGVVADKSFHDDVTQAHESREGLIEWLGFDSHYFASALVPSQGLFSRYALKDAEPNRKLLYADYDPWTIASSASVEVSSLLFVGPKNQEKLAAVKPSLDRMIDLGDWLGVIARPIQSLLRFLYQLIPNYGLDIILLTVIVRLMLWPLAKMQMSSMRRMQEHKPQLDALKERFGADREAYSREMMQYMRTHKINPMGGCLLLLPQLPIFFALYRVIFNTVELRHAPFVAWIQDLSAYDPWFVLPLLLGVAMYFQQKLTPSPGMDPAQQAVMKFMPVMFTVFMLFLPAGLNLYILVSTLWGVTQQAMIQRQIPAVKAAGQVVKEKISTPKSK